MILVVESGPLARLDPMKTQTIYSVSDTGEVESCEYLVYELFVDKKHVPCWVQGRHERLQLAKGGS